MMCRSARPLRWWLFVVCLAVAACSGDSYGLVPAQGFRLHVDWEGTAPVGEASHRLYFRPLDDVLDGHPFSAADRRRNRAFQFVSSDGTVLESHPVYSWHICVDPGGCSHEWEAVFEHPPDYTAFRFVDGSRIVYEEVVSPNAPEVSFLGLERDQVFAGDADFVFRLLIDDKDGDPLQTKMLVSVDDGPYRGTYPAFAESALSDLSIEDYGSPITMTSGVNVPGVARIVPAGSQKVRLLVAVSDGGRVGAARSPRFALEPVVAMPPLLQINDLQDGAIIGPQVPFDISASVREPVLIGDKAVNLDSSHPRLDGRRYVTWTSDTDGDITERVIATDTGGRVEAGALAPGTHELTATFVTKSGLRASDSVIVTILGPDDPVAAVDRPSPDLRGRGP